MSYKTISLKFHRYHFNMYAINNVIKTKLKESRQTLQGNQVGEMHDFKIKDFSIIKTYIYMQFIRSVDVLNF